MGRTFAAVIPMIPKHNKYLFSLVSELESASLKFEEIIVIASSQDLVSTEELSQISGRLNLKKLCIITTDKQRTAGENRNVGFDLATSDFICFLDSDDVYSPHRLEILDKVISSTNAELLYHDYFRLLPKLILDFMQPLRFSSLITSEELSR